MKDSTKATLEILALYAERWNAHPSLKSFGVVIRYPDPHQVKLRVDGVPASMRGGLGEEDVVNGGILSALCDILIGTTSALVDPTQRSATVQLSIRFERPLRGDCILGQAHVDHATKRSIFSSAEITDADELVCVRCQGIVSLLGAHS